MFMSVNRERLRKARVKKARSVLRNMKLDALLVTAWDSVRYITDILPYIQVDWYTDYYAAILPSDGKPVLIGKTMAHNMPEDVELFVGWENIPYISGQLVPDLWAEVFAKALKKLGLLRGRIGLDYMPFDMYEKLKRKVPTATFVSALYEILEARAIKNEEEIKLERKAARALCQGMEAGSKAIKPGVTEKQVFSKVASTIFEAGTEILPWSALCSGIGSNGLLPTDKKLKKGDLVFIDVGCILDGYCGDMARTLILGKAKRERELYSAVCDAHMTGIKAIRPGVKASEIDRIIRQTMKESGWSIDPATLGHGIGLKVTELPWITTKKELGSRDMELKSGMVICLEPGVTEPEKPGIGVEDMILVTDTGFEILTKMGY